jgi:hypothetical protein
MKRKQMVVALPDCVTSSGRSNLGEVGKVTREICSKVSSFVLMNVRSE